MYRSRKDTEIHGQLKNRKQYMSTETENGCLLYWMKTKKVE